MKKIRSMSEGEFLKLFFAFFTAAFLIAAVIMPDRASMLTGLWQILSQPSKLSTNYFFIGGYSATFLNMGLVGLICLLLYIVFKATPTNVSTLAFVLTLGFGSWGINILNVWPTIFGVMIYCVVKKEKFGANVNAMLFSTGIAPLITDLMIRYPNAEAIGFNLEGILIALVVGFFIGFFLPAGLANSPKVHKGFDLYSAALPVGMTAFFLNATLFKTLGVALPAGADAAQLQVASRLTVNTFCILLFGACILIAFALGCRPKDYWQLIIDPELVTNFSSTYGNPVFLMNVGLYGLFILAYYNLIGSKFTGATFGAIWCMLAFCAGGATPLNVLPIMIGYFIGSLFGVSAINAQGIIVGLCYASGLAPVSGQYGPIAGIVAGLLHYCLVTSVPAFHGGFNLYNGGFTCGIIAFVLVPILGIFFKSKDEKLAK